MTVSDPQAPVNSSPTVDVDRAEGADDYRLDLNVRARRVAKRACRSRAAYAMGHGYDEVHYVLQDLAVILEGTDGDGKLVLEAVQVSRVADACHWLAVHACDDVLADDAALVAYALREAVNVGPQVLPDGGTSLTGVERYFYVGIYQCQSCGEGFEVGDELVSLSDGFADEDEDFAVENRRFWHRECWEKQPVCKPGNDRSKGGDVR